MIGSPSMTKISEYIARQAAYKRKPYLQLAPDAFIFINQRMYVVICDRCNARRDLRGDISDITISKNMSGSPGTASVTLVTPRHGSINEYYFFWGRSTIPDFSEIEIYIKGRFLGADLMPRYYPVFWGMVTEVNYSYSDGSHTATLTCDDILRWLEIQTTVLRPSAVDQQFYGLPAEATTHTNHFWNMNIFSIVADLFHFNAADLMGPGSFARDEVGMAFHQGESGVVPFNLSRLHEKILLYWKARWSTIARSLKIIGVKAEPLFIHDVPYNERENFQPYSSIGDNQNAGFQYARPIPYYPEDVATISKFFPYSQPLGQPTFEQSERISKLEMINNLKTMIGWEFYQDMNGECIFKPPFWNIDVRPNYPVSVIEDEDIRSFDFNESEKRIQATRVEVYGSKKQEMIGMPGENQPHAFYLDYSLAAQYGIRNMVIEAGWINNVRDAFIYAILRMDRANIDRVSVNMTIVGRPELRLAFPVYVKPLDMFLYVSSISHNFSFSSKSFSTSLGLTAGRYKVRKDVGGDIPYPISVLNSDPEFQSSSPPFIDAAFVVGAAVGEPEPKVEPMTPEETKRYKYMLEHNLFATEFGYWEMEENSGITHVDVNENPCIKIPFTDEEGYRLYGGYEYGRGLVVDQDGVIRSSAEISVKSFMDIGNINLDNLTSTLSTAVTATLAPGDTLLKFEDNITMVSQLAREPGDPATNIITESAADVLVNLSPSKSLSFCTCKLRDAGTVSASGTK